MYTTKLNLVKQFAKKPSFMKMVVAILLTLLSFDQLENLYANPIEIHSWEDLHEIRTTDPTGHYLLMTNLDENSPGYDTYASADANGGAGWEPLNFSGTFDGNGYTIADLVINRPL